MTRVVYSVSGMTCGSCASTVSAEVGQVPGVAKVRVDLTSGQVDVVTEGPIDDAAIRAAVTAAGYQLATP